VASTGSSEVARQTAGRKLPWSEIIAFVAVAGIVAAGVLAGVLAGASPQGILTNVGFYASIAVIFAVLALGFNLQWGYTGLFNAGIAGFYLIGAYTMAIAITAPAPPIVIGGIPVYPGHLGGYSLPLAIGAILAMFASGAAAAIIALPALRLRADYLAIATLAFASILQIFANNLQSVTGGAIGITGIPKPVEFTSADAPFLNASTIVGIGSAILLVLILLLQFMAESPWGRVLRAVREDEEATMALGKNTFNYKLQAFALGGALMGLAGALFAVTLGYVSPSSSFAPTVTFSVWVMVIVGGSGNNRGAIVGAFLIYGMEWLSVQLKDLVPQNPLVLPPGLQGFATFIVLIGVVVTLTGLLYIVTGWGLLKLRMWAWWLTVIASIVSIVSQLTQFVVVPAYGFPYLIVLPISLLVYFRWVRPTFMQARAVSASSSNESLPPGPPSFPKRTPSITPRRPVGITVLGVLAILFGFLAVPGGLVVLAAFGFIVRDTIFYIRIMIIGVLLILLILHRPEGILREKKRVLG